MNTEQIDALLAGSFEDVVENVKAAVIENPKLILEPQMRAWLNDNAKAIVDRWVAKRAARNN